MTDKTTPKYIKCLQVDTPTPRQESIVASEMATTLEVPHPIPENAVITFRLDDGWIMKMQTIDGHKRLLFNQKRFPDMCENDFAKEVVRLVEETYLSG